MDNYFAYQKALQEQEAQTIQFHFKQKKNEKLKSREENLKTMRAIRSKSRITKFYEDLESEGNLLFRMTTSGVNPLLHPKFHDFRPRDKAKDIGDATHKMILRSLLFKIYNTYYSSYTPAKERAELTSQQHQSLQLTREDYDAINTANALKLREREKMSEQEPMRFGLNGRTENERLKKIMQSNILTDYQVQTFTTFELKKGKKFRNDKKSCLAER